LRSLFEDVKPNRDSAHISLGIGEPRHPTPELIKRALRGTCESSATYPPTAGGDALRQAIADCWCRRYGLRGIDWKNEVTARERSREALFCLRPDRGRPSRRSGGGLPESFYQIYEGAALLAGARPHYVNTTAIADSPRLCFDSADVWRRTQLLLRLLAGANPTEKCWVSPMEGNLRARRSVTDSSSLGRVLFPRSIRRSQPPLGALQAAAQLAVVRAAGDVLRLSKRSNVPGMRSGFVAGDAAVLKAFLLYRTLSRRCHESGVQEASIAAWRDGPCAREPPEVADKFARVTPTMQTASRSSAPTPASTVGRTPIEDTNSPVASTRSSTLPSFREFPRA